MLLLFVLCLWPTSLVRWLHFLAYFRFRFRYGRQLNLLLLHLLWGLRLAADLLIVSGLMWPDLSTPLCCPLSPAWDSTLSLNNLCLYTF